MIWLGEFFYYLSWSANYKDNNSLQYKDNNLHCVWANNFGHSISFIGMVKMVWKWFGMVWKKNDVELFNFVNFEVV